MTGQLVSAGRGRDRKQGFQAREGAARRTVAEQTATLVSGRIQALTHPGHSVACVSPGETWPFVTHALPLREAWHKYQLFLPRTLLSSHNRYTARPFQWPAFSPTDGSTSSLPAAAPSTFPSYRAHCHSAGCWP